MTVAVAAVPMTADGAACPGTGIATSGTGTGTGTAGSGPGRRAAPGAEEPKYRSWYMKASSSARAPGAPTGSVPSDHGVRGVGVLIRPVSAP
ncbi:hypothetical protein GCM10023083_03410 [Streptomyces phyllanthi]